MAEWRFIAKRALGDTLIDSQVPFNLSAQPRREVSGPGSLRGTIDVEWGRLIGSDGLPVIDEWSTAIYAELAGQIRWGGLVISKRFNGQAFEVECAGFSCYPNGIPYLGDPIQAGLSVPQKDPYAGKDNNHDGYVDGTNPPRSKKVPPPPPPIITPQIDTFEVVRRIWKHLQDQPDGNLGLVVDTGNSGILLGAKDGSDPYELAWWEAPDCGAEIDALARTAPFEFVEEHAWVNRDTWTVSHNLRLAAPRIGRRRSDLRFAQDENLVEMVAPEGPGEAFANEGYGIGKGEGRTTITSRIPQRDGRLRRVRVVQDKMATASRIEALTRLEVKKATQVLTVPMIVVRDHQNARVGSWRPGDDILVQADLPWIGRFSAWHRIMAEQYRENGDVELTLVRAETV